MPFWDAWDGEVAFFLRARDGDASAWWEFHNEHRIVLTRLFFYADMAWGHGIGILPLVANVVLAALAAACVCFAVRRLTPAWSAGERIPWYALVIGLLSFWSQAQNFTWAFQPQFFLACLLPLTACIGTAATVTATRPAMPFALACASAVLAAGSMANGVLAAPMIAALAICLRMRWRYTVTALALAGAALITARLGYHGASGGSLVAARAHPALVGEFLLLYLGSPVGAMLEVSRTSLVISMLVGLATLVAVTFASARAWQVRHDEPLRLALAMFALFVCASALAAAVGRIDLGPVSALSGRYTTPVLTAWAGTIAALLPRFAPRGAPAWVPMAVLVAGLPAQVTAVRPQSTVLHERELAALALELQIHDPATLVAIYPRPVEVLGTALAARDAGLGVFGYGALAGLHSLMGQVIERSRCFAPASIVPGQGASPVLRLAVMPALSPMPSLILLANRRGTIIGAAIRARAPQTESDLPVDYDGYVVNSPAGAMSACSPPNPVKTRPE
ncbi:hypothetical protein [Luteibacter aegosomatissinici]|uniref:hypothetical protein n=1 Tax=Luteibacter aegosomatissinici TaxID=2911539 RepID=UPI001FFB2215|nr:hypothetical protein [Luteibacter aegosomatissinici]UPG95360.1 hypothetical protein L2Y97_04385 [Luteibacter aegosomatissinici]